MDDATFEVPEIPLVLVEQCQAILDRARKTRREYHRLLAEWVEADGMLDSLTEDYPEPV